MRDFVLASAGAAIGLFIGAMLMVSYRSHELERGYLLTKGRLYLVTPAKPVPVQP